MKEQTRKSNLGTLIQKVLKEHPAFSPNPLGDWQELVGDQVAQYTAPHALKKKVLTIMAYDSIWKHHLELHKEVIMEKINRGHAEPLIDKIVIRVGDINLSPPELNPQYKRLEKIKPKHIRSKKKKISRRKLSPEEKELLRQLPDAELRTIGARLLSCLRLEGEDEDVEREKHRNI